MDNVLVDFKTGIKKLSEDMKIKYEGNLDDVPGIFSLMEPMPYAIDSIHTLNTKYDIYVLSTAPWLNSSAWQHKVEWIQKYFGKNKDSILYKKLILTHHKNLNLGDYLIDDRTKNGADRFMGEHIHFGTERFPNWQVVTNYLM